MEAAIGEIDRAPGASAASAGTRADRTGRPRGGRTKNVLGQTKQNPTVTFYAAGLGVMFLFSAAGAGGALIEEAESGTLDRILATRVSMTPPAARKARLPRRGRRRAADADVHLLRTCSSDWSCGRTCRGSS